MADISIATISLDLLKNAPREPTRAIRILGVINPSDLPSAHLCIGQQGELPLHGRAAEIDVHQTV
jgi:hypothetical protein